MTTSEERFFPSDEEDIDRLYHASVLPGARWESLRARLQRHCPDMQQIPDEYEQLGRDLVHAVEQRESPLGIDTFSSLVLKIPVQAYTVAPDETSLHLSLPDKSRIHFVLGSHSVVQQFANEKGFGAIDSGTTSLVGPTQPMGKILTTTQALARALKGTLPPLLVEDASWLEFDTEINELCRVIPADAEQDWDKLLRKHYTVSAEDDIVPELTLVCTGPPVSAQSPPDKQSRSAHFEAQTQLLRRIAAKRFVLASPDTYRRVILLVQRIWDTHRTDVNATALWLQALRHELRSIGAA